MSAPRVVLVDHKDSFVHNLANQCRSLGADVRVFRCTIGLDDFESRLRDIAPDLVLLSPGPGRPEDAGVTTRWLARDPQLPILGICLGHQALAVAAGGRVERAPSPVHGRSFLLELQPDPVFAGVSGSFVAARYHSLHVTDTSPDYRVIATAQDGGGTIVMAMRHRTLPRIGFQFHPESFLTPYGGRLIANALDEACAHRTNESLAPTDSSS